MRGSPLSGLSICAAALLAAGCAGQAAPDRPVPENAVPVSIMVENRSEFAAEIYTYRNRQRTRLGLVETGKTLILPFMWDAPDVQFIIDLVGDMGAMSGMPEQERRNAFATDAAGDTVPCILTEKYAVTADATLTLVVPEGLADTQGRSRCAR